MSAHTPGPWIWIEHGAAMWLVPIADYQKDPDYPADYAICDDGSAYGEYSQKIDPSSANGRLLAAAPDLLEALIKFREAFVVAAGDKSPFCKFALVPVDAAIAKARGES